MTLAIPSHVSRGDSASSQASQILTANTEGDPPAFPNAGRITSKMDSEVTVVEVPLPFLAEAETTTTELESVMNKVRSEPVTVEIRDPPHYAEGRN